MSRRAALPGASELFRTTSSSAALVDVAEVKTETPQAQSPAGDKGSSSTIDRELSTSRPTTRAVRRGRRLPDRSRPAASGMTRRSLSTCPQMSWSPSMRPRPPSTAIRGSRWTGAESFGRQLQWSSLTCRPKVRRASSRVACARVRTPSSSPAAQSLPCGARAPQGARLAFGRDLDDDRPTRARKHQRLPRPALGLRGPVRPLARSHRQAQARRHRGGPGSGHR